jgi:hypothetical protein
MLNEPLSSVRTLQVECRAMQYVVAVEAIEEENHIARPSSFVTTHPFFPSLE